MIQQTVCTIFASPSSHTSTSPYFPWKKRSQESTLNDAAVRTSWRGGGRHILASPLSQKRGRLTHHCLATGPRDVANVSGAKPLLRMLPTHQVTGIPVP